MGEAKRRRVNGQEPNGTMGRLVTLDLPVHFIVDHRRRVWFPRNGRSSQQVLDTELIAQVLAKLDAEPTDEDASVQ